MASVPYDSPSGIGLGQRDPWTVKDNTKEQERIWEGRVIRVPAFNYEFGSRTVKELTDDAKLEDEDKFVEYFKTHLYGKAYKTYVCDLGDQEPIIIIIQGKDRSPVAGPAVAKKMQSRKVMIISKKDDERLLIPLVAGKVRIKDMLRQLRPDLQGAEFKQIVDETIDADLLDFMTKQIITTYKFGVLYQREGQTDEDQWYNNIDGSSELEEFLTFLGDRITLNGWTKFRGGLSVNDEKTGTHSIYTNFAGLEIMFHVSTYIPYYPNDPQQVERKRHLGNDVVVIVFRESDCTVPFDPLKIKSQFNHTFCVVQPVAGNRSGGRKYNICFISRDSGQPYGPVLPAQPVFARDERLRKWLLTKLVNAERAAMYSPEFKERLWKARRMILHDLVLRHTSHHTRVGAAAATGVDAVGGGLKKIITAPVTVARAVPLPLHKEDSRERAVAVPLSVRSPRDKDEVVSLTVTESPNLLSTSFGNPISPKKSGENTAPLTSARVDKEKLLKELDLVQQQREKAKEAEREKERERVEREKEKERERADREREEKERMEKEKHDKEERREQHRKEKEEKKERQREAERLKEAERAKEAEKEKEREKLEKSLSASNSLSSSAPLNIAPEDRPVFMEEESTFSPPLGQSKLKKKEDSKKKNR